MSPNPKSIKQVKWHQWLCKYLESEEFSVFLCFTCNKMHDKMSQWPFSEIKLLSENGLTSSHSIKMITYTEMWFRECSGVWKGKCLEILTCIMSHKRSIYIHFHLWMCFFFWQLLPRWSIGLFYNFHVYKIWIIPVCIQE